MYMPQLPAPPGRPFWTRHFRREVQYVLDLVVLSLAFAVSYLLRFEFALPRAAQDRLFQQLPLVVLVHFAALLFVGAYNFIWRYISLAELATFVRAVTFASGFVLALRLGLPERLEEWQVPISVILIDAVLSFGGLLGIRILRRTIYERFERVPGGFFAEAPAKHGQPTLFIGAGRAGLRAVRELERQPSRELEIVGFLDDDPQKQGSVVHGIRVLGTSADMARVVTEEKIEVVVITMIKASRETMRSLLKEGRRLGVEVRVMPSLFEILEGRLAVARFREVRIDDLLGREAVELDKEEMHRFLTARRVLVTGAGGSIGSELARQCARFYPSRLILVERSEPALFAIHREMRSTWPDIEIVPHLADCTDEIRMRAVLGRERPAILLHAAAHKHVPLVEGNPCEAAKNNSLGTRLLGTLAGELGIERFVLVSTDKAVRPTSVMGATKRLAELFIQDLDQQFPETRFLAVRFGNVLGSTGSVVPIFREQIERGGPVTVTDPDMVRYFMTIPEASQLVLQAATMGEGGEIFVLDMGEPVKIVNLARDMIRLAGLRPDEDIEIVFTGRRPGEKLYEELELDSEGMTKTRHPKIFIGKLEPYPRERVGAMLVELGELCRLQDDGALRAFLSAALPEATLDGEPHAPLELSGTTSDRERESIH